MTHDSINSFLSNLVERSVLDLEASFCLEIGADNSGLTPTTLGKISVRGSCVCLGARVVRMCRAMDWDSI